MKPILFNTDMVRAILDGRKTVTRRAIKPRYRADESGFQVITRSNGEFVRVEKVDENECGIFADGTERYVNPPYDIGDILYVRETWTCMRDINTGHCDYFYAANQKDYDTVSSTYLCDDDGFDTGKPFPWKPSIHMPKEIARIFLRVTDVRAERLQEITEEQAEAEGVGDLFLADCAYDNKYANIQWNQEKGLGIHQFARLWGSTIKPADLPLYGWNANPWVWVVEFERTEVQYGS